MKHNNICSNPLMLFKSLTMCDYSSIEDLIYAKYQELKEGNVTADMRRIHYYTVLEFLSENIINPKIQIYNSIQLERYFNRKDNDNPIVIVDMGNIYYALENVVEDIEHKSKVEICNEVQSYYLKCNIQEDILRMEYEKIRA